MNNWDRFFEEKLKQIFENKIDIVDIGSGLRISKTNGNRFDPKREWLIKYLAQVNYKTLDPVADFNPDIVGDIHNLPLADNSLDAIICLAVLEHVENPFQAFAEMYRVLKPDGFCFVYVPFLYYYHAQPGYYGDFWRFTEDGLRHLSKNFSKIEMQKVRNPIETWIFLSPLGRFKTFNTIAHFLDSLIDKEKSKQTSGYFVFLTK